jgi:hypothetical protein
MNYSSSIVLGLVRFGKRTKYSAEKLEGDPWDMEDQYGKIILK